MIGTSGSGALPPAADKTAPLPELEREKAFDCLAFTVAQIMRAPMAMLVLGKRGGPQIKAAVRPRSLDPLIPALLARIVLRTRQRVVVSDMGRDPRFAGLFTPQQPPIMAALPLLADDGTCLGCLCVMRYGHQEFTRLELDRLAGLARHATDLLQPLAAAMDLGPVDVVP